MSTISNLRVTRKFDDIAESTLKDIENSSDEIPLVHTLIRNDLISSFVNGVSQIAT